MDSKPMTYTSPSNRSSSRMYQDLQACRSQSRPYSGDKSQQFNMSISKRETSDAPCLPKVCIVGAGITGLKCADILLQRGFEVTILEARERIGGRVHQIETTSGHIVDVGANWVHGTKGNPIFDLAKITNTATHSWDGQVNIFGDDGRLLPDGTALSESMWDIIVQGFKHSEGNSATIHPDESLHDFFTKKVAENHPGSNEAERRKTIMKMSELWGPFVGSSIKTQSMKFFWLEECLDGENLFCAGTFKKILNLIAKRALGSADLRLSTKVTRIETGSSKVKVFTKDGTELQFDEVVVTTPLGYLKQNKGMFVPPLTPRLSQAIDAIGYGSLEKVYLTFPRAFWLGDAKNPDNKPFTGFTQWLSPNYALTTNPVRWNQEAVDLSLLPGPCAHPTMLFYIFGEQSQAMVRKAASLPSKEAKGEYITKFFEPYFSLLPHYERESHDCQPSAWVATDWVLDEFAGNGSYSNFQTGLKDGDKDIEIMREGLPDRHLYLAGEHTAPFVALGTVTGAYWSGEGVAERISKAYGMTGNSNA